MQSKKFKKVMIIASTAICIIGVFMIIWTAVQRKQCENSKAQVQAEIAEYSRQQNALYNFARKLFTQE